MSCYRLLSAAVATDVFFLRLLDVLSVSLGACYVRVRRDDLFLSRMMRSHQYIGKLRSSTSMLEYCLYDQGDNPEDLDSDCEVDDELRKSIRAELAVIRYHNSKKVRVLLANGSRKDHCACSRAPRRCVLLSLVIHSRTRARWRS